MNLKCCTRCIQFHFVLALQCGTQTIRPEEGKHRETEGVPDAILAHAASDPLTGNPMNAKADPNVWWSAFIPDIQRCVLCCFTPSWYAAHD